jgi:inosine-uridine nucleoside N-ribohydrolase
MFSNLKKGVKRAIISTLVLGAVFVLVLTVTNLAGDKIFTKKLTRILIDSDTGNSPDELFAITRALIEPDFEIVGLTSVHSEFSQYELDNSVDQSQQKNLELLKAIGRSDIPHPQGAGSMLRFDDEPKPRNSRASDFIIQKAKETDKNQKLTIIAFGALTNIASAIIKSPEIIPNLRVYMVGMKYNPNTRVWNKNEKNSRNDLDALDFILNTEGLEINVMPANTACVLNFTKEETEKYLLNQGEVWEFLLAEWNEKHQDINELSMGDVALIQAIIDQSLAKSEETLPPPENSQRSIKAYTYINRELMVADFFAAVMKYQRSVEEE